MSRQLSALAALVLPVCCALAADPQAFFSVEFTEQDDPTRYLPVEVGTRWTYQNQRSSAITSTDSVITITWKSECVVLAHHKVPEGTVILREVQVRDVTFDYPATVPESKVAWFKEHAPKNGVSHYLIAGNYVFELFEHDWDSVAKTLTERWRSRFKQGQVTAKFFFPMGAVTMWSNRERERADFEMGELSKAGKGPAPNPGMYYWVCEAQEDLTVPYGDVQGAFLLVYRTNPDLTRVWFKPDIGVVKEASKHHGSYGEGRSTLLSFMLSESKPEE